MVAEVVTTAAALADAISKGAEVIEVQGTIAGSPMVTLPPGVTLRGGTLEFGAKGVRLSKDNTLDSITVLTAENEVAILNDTSVSDFGTLTLRNVTTKGQVLLLADDKVRAGHVQVEGLNVRSADVRGRFLRPHGFGVDALQGGLTLWNLQADSAVRITAEIVDVSIGTKESPVRGSGVFVGGHGDWDGHGDGGVLVVSHLRTGEIHTDGGIAPGTPDLISGGVFVISGARVERVTNAGSVTTYGQNDMVLDNWGAVTTWTATAPVTSHGPSGIGFVNFGDIDFLDVQAPIRTTGKGARGFNLYDGSLREGRFHSIATTGDGSVGIQISRPLGMLSVSGDVSTSGSEGMSLVKGVQMPLKAIALSIKPGGQVDRVDIGGKLATSRDRVVTLEIEGEVATLSVEGGIHATGQGSDGAHVAGSLADLSTIQIAASHGQPLVHT